jgi:cytochrome c-type biogenesis protein CcmH
MVELHTSSLRVGRVAARRRWVADFAWPATRGLAASLSLAVVGLFALPAAAQGPKPEAAVVSASAVATTPMPAASAAPAAAETAAPVVGTVSPAVAGSVALGPEAAPMTDEPVLEARLLKLSEELRCLVCQNESLASSRAELADDLRREVRSLLSEGKTDQQVKNFLVERYGDFVLYRPELKPMTWLLWFGPFVLLLGAVAGLWWYLRQRRQLADTAPALSDAERARVDQWLKD